MLYPLSYEGQPAEILAPRPPRAPNVQLAARPKAARSSRPGDIPTSPMPRRTTHPWTSLQPSGHPPHDPSLIEIPLT